MSAGSKRQLEGGMCVMVNPAPSAEERSAAIARGYRGLKGVIVGLRHDMVRVLIEATGEAVWLTSDKIEIDLDGEIERITAAIAESRALTRALEEERERLLVENSRACIVSRLRELVEAEDPTQPWPNKNEKARFLAGCATLIEEEGRKHG